MKVSVIIPTFNRAEVLPRALDSVFSQSYPAHEVLLIDDGSTDDTQSLIKQKYPKCHYIHQKNQGVSAARNTGILAASGDWIALLDSDDEWLSNKLANQKNLLTGSEQLRLCHTEEIWIRNGKRVNAMKKHAKTGGDIFLNCLPLCVISPSSVLIHRNIFDQYGLFDTSLPACEDYDLWLKICAHETVGFIDTAQIRKYGGHDDQLSRQYWGMDRFRIQALERIIKEGKLKPSYQLATIKTVIKKSAILSQGARKRQAHDRGDQYETIQKDYQTLLESLE